MAPSGLSRPPESRLIDTDMHTHLDCIPCIVRQSLATARFVTDDPATQEAILRRMLHGASTMNLEDTPPKMARILQQTILEMTGVYDPYQEMKHQFNQFALAMQSELEAITAAAADPFEMAVRLAIAGNIIDFGAIESVDSEMVHRAIDESRRDPIDTHAIAALGEASTQARTILFLGDNCGEIVFDQLLLRRMPLEKITYVVKGGPCINDATMEDAEETGLCQLLPVISNGLDAPGTILEDCSPEFQARFHAADLIVAKGQANYETLSHVEKPIFFILKAKCPVVACHLGVPLGGLVVKSTPLALHRGNSPVPRRAPIDPPGV